MLDALFDNQAAWFSVPAIVGTAVFLLRLILMLVGGAAGGMDLDIDHPGDIHHGEPGSAFQLLSIQSIFAFAMGFGWAGLGALKSGGLEMPVSMLIAVAGGAAMVWMLALLLKGVHDLQSSGNVPIHATVGREGDVYVTVPARGEGSGQVRVTVGQSQKIYNAHSEGEALPTGTRIKVTKANQDNTLTVGRA